MNIISVYPNFANQGGAQDVLLNIANELSEKLPIVLCDTKKHLIHSKYTNRAYFYPFSYSVVKRFANYETVFFSHHRKSTLFLLLFNFLLGNKMHVIHVVHNTFNDLRYCSFFPKRIIAVSNAVRDNLIDYFRVPAARIRVIYNGLQDQTEKRDHTIDSLKIRVLIPARICKVKQQVKIVNATKNCLKSHVEIYFAGDGEDKDILKKLIVNDSQYHYMGRINVFESLADFDYVCLFSEKEGLPLSLIEGFMFSKPIITNDLPVFNEINNHGATGYICNDFDSLVDCLNNLPHPGSDLYKKLSSNARKRYEMHFTVEKMLQKYFEYAQEELEDEKNNIN